MNILAIVCNFKWGHIDYMHALAGVFDLKVAWCGEAHEGAVARARKEGLDLVAIDRLTTSNEAEVREQIARVVAGWNPELVHLLYYYHEALTVLVRELLPVDVPLVFECRDPLTTLRPGGPDSENWRIEKQALLAADGHVFVSRRMREYYESSHGLDLKQSSIIIPHAFAARTAAPPSSKLSAADGRVHLALVGSLQPDPGDNRYYVDIIKRLVAAGIVVHSHFHKLDTPHDPYLELAGILEDYHYHPTETSRGNTDLSRTISRYDLMGVFHQIDATGINEAATLALCMPTKAVCGWHHGAIPVVCYPYYGGLVPLIEEMGTGFVIEQLEDIAAVAADRVAIDRATRACLVHRGRFSHEHNVAMIRRFYQGVLAGRNFAAGQASNNAV